MLLDTLFQTCDILFAKHSNPLVSLCGFKSHRSPPSGRFFRQFTTFDQWDKIALFGIYFGSDGAP